MISNLFLYEAAKLLTTIGMGRVRVNTPMIAQNPPRLRPKNVYRKKSRTNCPKGQRDRQIRKQA